jgi:putative peptidoglycan lipid II flippase
VGKSEGIQRFRSAAILIAAWTLASRILGLVRDRLMFATFGRGWESSAFWLAWTVPNLFRRLLGEGALSAIFVPVLTRKLQNEGVEGARRSLSIVFGALFALLSLLVLCGLLIVFMLPDDALGRSGVPESGALTRRLLLTLLPYMLPICLVALAAAAQNVRGRFALPSLAPFVLNCFWIAALLYVSGQGDGSSLTEKALLVAGALVVGGLFQLLLQLPGLARSGMLVRPRLDPHDESLRETGRTMLPMLLGLSVIQLNVLANQVIAAYLVRDIGGNSVIFLAVRLLEFPHALVGIALGTAVFPLLSHLGKRKETDELGHTLDKALSLGLLVAIPAAGGLLVLAPQLVDVLFVSGRFTSADGVETAWCLRILSLSLPGLIAIQILARAHYALEELKRPVRIAVVVFLTSVVLNLFLAPRFGTYSLAATSSLSALGNAFLLFLSLRSFTLPHFALTLRSIGKSLAATVPMALAAYATARWGMTLAPDNSPFVQRLVLHLLMPVTAGILTFLLFAWMLRVTELRELWIRKKRG